MKRSHTIALGSFASLSAVLIWRAGADTWAQEAPAILAPALRSQFEAFAPLPGPVYNAEILLFGLLGAACLAAMLRLATAVVRGTSLTLRLALRGRSALGESGQAMTEVAVSFPVLLITTLILMQLALMFQAKNVVTYAAFSAARSAIVWIPSEGPPPSEMTMEWTGDPSTDPEWEDKHEISVGNGAKWDKIHQAAALACVPISPKASIVLDGLPFIGDIIADAFSFFTDMLSGFGLAGTFVDNALQRYAYSAFATQVRLYQATESGMEEQSGDVVWQYPGGGDVGVEVIHRYYLPIPLVNRIIGDDWSIVDMGPFFSIELPGEYTTIRAVSVLPLEGETGGPDDAWAAPSINGFWDTFPSGGL